jgi:hypothetical protein
MCGKQIINIWLAFRVLGLEMNFVNFISVTCICWHVGNCKFAFRYKNGWEVARIKNRKFVFAEFLSKSTFL